MEEDNLIFQGDAVKAVGDGRVEGYLVRFTSADDMDQTGDFFTAETDFGEAEKTAIYYQHAQDAKLGNRRIGTGDMKKDEVGVWLSAQLNMRDAYERAIYKMVEDGKLGWSSGTAPHLVKRKAEGKGYRIVAWPLGLDASLTPTPAEPRNLAVSMKSYKPVEGLLPDAPEGAEEPDTDETKTMTVKSEETEMSEEIKTEKVETVETHSEVDALREEIKALKLKIESAPAVETKSVKLSGGDKFESTKTLYGWITGRISDGEYKAALAESVDATGGVLVPNDFYNRVVAAAARISAIRRMGVLTIPTNRDIVDIPVEDTAATRFVITAEGTAYNENEPTFRLVSPRVYKFTKLVKLSEEIDADNAVNLDAYLVDVFARALAETEDYYLLANGTGTGMPGSILQRATLGTTAASATALTPGEVIELAGKVPSGFQDNVVLAMHPSTLSYIRAMRGQNFLFQAAPSVTGNGQDYYIDGHRVFTSDAMPTMATGARVIVAVNPQLYAMVVNSGLTVMRNPYLYQETGQIGIFARARFGGDMLINTAAQYLAMA